MPPGLGAFILPSALAAPSEIPDLITLVEFVCSIVAVSGHPALHSVAMFSDNKCRHVRYIPRSTTDSLDITFVSGLTAPGLLQWLQRCLRANKNHRDRMHITAHHFVRSVKSESLADAAMDLCISLESLLDHQTEVSFRFSLSLARLSGARGEQCEKNAALLAVLYEARSKLAHGDPAAAKLLRKLEPRRSELNALAKDLLTTYVLHASEHTRADWKTRVQKSLYS